jgi:serine/threonine protein kinase
VHLIGYCLENNDEIILVYQYMARGSLRDNLQNVLLSWKRRLEICIGTALALQKLHRSRLIHCNVNTKDILLDEEWNAKVSDLGFCRIGP